MTDIVRRLRSEGALAGHYNAPAIQREAADEIERLRAERAVLRQMLRLAEKAMRATQSYGSDKAQASADLAYQAVVTALKENDQ